MIVIMKFHIVENRFTFQKHRNEIIFNRIYIRQKRKLKILNYQNDDVFRSKKYRALKKLRNNEK